MVRNCRALDQKATNTILSFSKKKKKKNGTLFFFFFPFLLFDEKMAIEKRSILGNEKVVGRQFLFSLFVCVCVCVWWWPIFVAWLPEK